MIKKCGFLFLLFPIFLQAALFDWSSNLSPQAKRAQTVIEGIDPMIEQALKDYQIPGLAVGVVVDGHVVYAKGFGYRDAEKKLPVDPKTLFAVGSITKAFTTFVAGNLVDEGLIAWDQPVFDVLPEFRMRDNYATQNVTIRDLLTHRSGMPRHEFVWYNSNMTKEELLHRIRYLEPSHEIRERYQYNNLMYFIAGCALEKASGKTWKQLVTERILKPLEMKATNFSVEEMLKTSNFANPYVEKKGTLQKVPFRNLTLIGPAGSLNSNIDDLTRWVQLHLNGGIYKGHQMISPATLQELHAPQVVISGAPETKETRLSAYGIGWRVDSYRSHYLISHDAVSDGFTSVVALIPDKNVGVIVLANRNLTALPRWVSLQLLDRILEIPGTDWFKEGLEGLRKNKETTTQNMEREDLMRKKGTTPSHPLDDYAGEYEHPGYGKVNIENDNGRLKMVYNGLVFYLGHWHYDVFNIEEEGQTMVISLEGTKCKFSNNLNGDVSEISIPLEPTGNDIVFEKKRSAALSTVSYLKQFAGVYEVYGYTIEVVLRNNSLIAIIPGQPNHELIPYCENEFIVKALTGATIRFVQDPVVKNVREVLLILPYGTFTATPRR
jgi:CubicO group peptidase (beta-lactamase class C family)